MRCDSLTVGGGREEVGEKRGKQGEQCTLEAVFDFGVKLSSSPLCSLCDTLGKHPCSPQIPH